MPSYVFGSDRAGHIRRDLNACGIAEDLYCATDGPQHATVPQVRGAAL